MSCHLPAALRLGSRTISRALACLVLVALVTGTLVVLSDPNGGVGRLIRWPVNHSLSGSSSSFGGLPDPARVTAVVLQGKKEYDELGHERWNFTGLSRLSQR